MEEIITECLMGGAFFKFFFLLRSYTRFFNVNNLPRKTIVRVKLW